MGETPCKAELGTDFLFGIANMRVRTVKVEGRFSTVEGHTFEYPLGSVESITSGRWELAISHIAIIFGAGSTWNNIYEVSTNYIDTVTVGANGIRHKEAMALAFFRAKGQENDKIMLGFRCRDYFEITNASKIFKVTLKQIEDPDMVNPGPGENANAFVSFLFIFRRVE